MEKALFGAGCFWGVEDFFRQVPGVSDAVSGYAGGTTDSPSYRQVCGGDTYHAEVVEVTFDPAKVSYRALVELFFRMHNPTQRNRQGPDFGTQYRSVIFTHGAEQARIAAAVEGRGGGLGQVEAAHRHPDRARPRLLEGRGKPPALFPEAWRLLPRVLRGVAGKSAASSQAAGH